MMTLDEFLVQWHDDNPRLLVHTSGSTGQPKPLWVEKCRMVESARITCDFLGLCEGDSALLCMPLDYIAGKMMVVRALHRRLRLVSVPPSSHPLASLDTAPSFAAMVPLQVYNSLQVPRERALLMRIRHLLIGGGAVDDALARQLLDFPHAVWSTYGMTETLSHIALRRLSGPDASAWYQPFHGVSLTTDAEGCLVIDAPAVCPVRLVTNDIVRLSADGRFRVVGRRDNVICSGGVKIQIEEVESLLRPHLVHPFLITYVPDEKLGQAVTLLTESPNPSEDMLLCSRLLPAYWKPRYAFHVDRLPSTATGKPARAVAHDMAVALSRG